MDPTQDILKNKVLTASLSLLKSPCVYVVREGLKVLYVGSSAKGLARPCDPHHHVLKDIDSENAIVDVFACETPGQALRHEELLIMALKPELNKTDHVSIEKTWMRRALNWFDENIEKFNEELEAQARAQVELKLTMENHGKV